MERRIQRDLLDELFQEKEAEIGPPTPEIEERAAATFREAEALAANACAAQDHEGNAGPE
ncbi:hypothetical protein [Streptomyces sp. NPDC050704]|uniref:hypothetical protein n=1 Tax=Streptomyces sp. NPDC050704 TaxID=3157219 RepID=UPI00341BFB6D